MTDELDIDLGKTGDSEERSTSVSSRSTKPDVIRLSLNYGTKEFRREDLECRECGDDPDGIVVEDENGWLDPSPLCEDHMEEIRREKEIEFEEFNWYEY